MSYLVTISRGGTDSESIPCRDVAKARIKANEGWADIATTLIIIVNQASGVSTSWDRRPKNKKRYR